MGQSRSILPTLLIIIIVFLGYFLYESRQKIENIKYQYTEEKKVMIKNYKDSVQKLNEEIQLKMILIDTLVKNQENKVVIIEQKIVENKKQTHEKIRSISRLSNDSVFLFLAGIRQYGKR